MAISHNRARELIQDSVDRNLTRDERIDLGRHLQGCRRCLDYEDTHRDILEGARAIAAARSWSPPRRDVVEGYVRRKVGRRRTVRKVLQMTASAAMAVGVVLFGLLVSPRIWPGANIPGGVVTPRPSPSPSPTPKAADLLIVSPSPSPTGFRVPSSTRTPLPMFDFHRLEWEDVRFFGRGAQDVYTPEQLPSAGLERQRFSTIAEAMEASGLEKFLRYEVPDGWQFEYAWAYPAEMRVDACYLGPQVGSRPMDRQRWCIRQQEEPFADFIGRSGQVFPLEIEGVYAEQAVGSWVSFRTEGELKYQWNEWMGGAPQFRLLVDGVFVELWGPCGGRSECLMLDIGDSLVQNSYEQ